MTIKQARKILGKLAEGISDEDIERDIKVAGVLKSLFFSKYSKNSTLQFIYNNKDNGKT